MKKYKKIVLILTVLICVFNITAYGAGNYDYILDEKGKRIAIPLTYKVEKVFSYFDEAGYLNNAQDLFMDKDEKLYVVDTGNNRIIKLTRDGNLLGTYDGDTKKLNSPNGIYVDDDGDMYIADTGNGRVVHLSPEGKFVEEFVQPKSPLYDTNSPFRPSKVYVDAINQIYTLNDDYHGFTVLDGNNQFKGYVAPTRLEFSFTDVLIRMFASPEQKEKLSKRLPPAHSNFVITDDGMIYATTLRAKTEQIKKMTTLGNNIYPEDGFFGEDIDEYGNKIEPSFVDISVDDNGIITALESSTCRLYQYDQEGNLLTVFGGRGTYRGKFLFPTSVVQDKNGRMYVLDSRMNNIQVFERTKFIETVHHALNLYYDGKYQEAIEPWEEILKVGPNYYVAHKGMGKAYMKQEKWKQSMKSYRLADDREGYSDAFSEYRHSIFRKYFGWIVLAIIGVIVAIIKFVRYLRRLSGQMLRQTKTWKGVI
ncbi:MAG: SMP-30/gluconolactonase/LRE family protein [Xylanivirga thermophila]|jgi:hypothetical protein|uniref:hypothetical protein n=1 Tax=Xylanivirga thermophila TaxID=2496273 RepID=UPI0039F4A7D8